ncbi:unnamed protein product, partial [marine sediment metagenome]
EDADVIKRLRSSGKFKSAIIEITPEEEKKIKRRAKIDNRAKEIAKKQIEEEEEAEAKESKKE